MNNFSFFFLILYCSFMFILFHILSVSSKCNRFFFFFSFFSALYRYNYFHLLIVQKRKKKKERIDLKKQYNPIKYADDNIEFSSFLLFHLFYFPPPSYVLLASFFLFFFGNNHFYWFLFTYGNEGDDQKESSLPV